MYTIVIFEKKSTLYSLIQDCKIINFRYFPHYMNLIQAYDKLKSSFQIAATLHDN